METTFIDYELPEGWTTTVLDKVGYWSTGGTPSRKVITHFGGGIPWVKSGDLNDGRVRITEETLTREGIESSAAKVLPAGAVSIALYGATIGKLGMLEIDAATNQACANCEVIEEIIDRWFLFYYLLSQRRALIEAGQGGAQPNINNRIIRNWPLLLAPLAEQRRIVAKLEELLARVNAAKERLAKVSMILKRFRQAVLTAACSGRLTDDWRNKNSNIEPASELLKRVRVERKEKLQKVQNQEVNTNDLPTIPESWAFASVGELEKFIGSGITPRGGKSVYREHGVPFIRSQNVYPTGLVLKDIAFITPEIHNKMSRTKLKGKDVLLNITGASIGRATYVPENFGEGNVNQHVSIIRLEAVISHKYTTLFLNSPIGQDLIFSKQGGVTREGLNYGQIRNFIIPVPPSVEQHEIVRRVEVMFKLANVVENRVAAAAVRSEKLTQAILAKAFRGELVPTEAELARRKGRSYEPASDLLTRIKSERESKGGYR